MGGLVSDGTVLDHFRPLDELPPVDVDVDVIGSVYRRQKKMVSAGRRGGGTTTGGHIKQDLRYTQKSVRFVTFTNNIRSYLLWSLPRIDGLENKETFR